MAESSCSPLPDDLRRSAAHVVVSSLEAPALEAADAHHLARVLRLRDGELVTVTDGAGRWRRCRWIRGGLEPDGPTQVVARAEPSITIGFAPAKGDRPEWTVQKLTEIGVDRIVPLRTARSVVRWEGARAGQAVDRLRRVAREAAMQARRCRLPEVADVAAPAMVPDAVLAEPGGGPPSLEHPVVLIGPEGGWSEEELAAAPGTVAVGALILRSETAAVAAAVLLAARRNAFLIT
jgi:16S rRNA (uracil1498-N3)-methyltransferase